MKEIDTLNVLNAKYSREGKTAETRLWEAIAFGLYEWARFQTHDMTQTFIPAEAKEVLHAYWHEPAFNAMVKAIMIRVKEALQ